MTRFWLTKRISKANNYIEKSDSANRPHSNMAGPNDREGERMRRYSYLMPGFVFAILIIFLCCQNATLRAQEASPPASEPKEEQVAKPAKEEPAAEMPAEERPVEGEPAPVFPLAGEIAGDAVNVRSGPGTNYSIIIKLNKGDEVVVLGEEFGWVRIEVPPATFSWVSARFVERGEENQGTITANRVNIRAGSGTDFDVLGQVNRGDIVEIVDEVEQWYKIKPPAAAKAWVHSDYISYAEKAVTPPAPPVVKPDDTPEIFARAEKLYEAEREKPAGQWDFSACVPLYQEVVERSQNPSLRYLAASRLRFFSLHKRFQERMEERMDMVARTDRRLREALLKIDERKKKEDAEIAARVPGMAYTATGRIEKLVSSFYPQATHKLMRGNIAIYLLTSEKLNLDDFLGQEVYIQGTVEETLIAGVFLIRVDEVKLK
jgi:uncharacterized protein YgiM (DUF1202 family)